MLCGHKHVTTCNVNTLALDWSFNFQFILHTIQCKNVLSPVHQTDDIMIYHIMISDEGLRRSCFMTDFLDFVNKTKTIFLWFGSNTENKFARCQSRGCKIAEREREKIRETGLSW